MANYGYRLYTFQIANGDKRKAVNFKDCSGEHYVDVAQRLLKSLSQQTMIGDAPLNSTDVLGVVNDQSQGDVQRYVDEPAFRVEEVRVVDRTIRATVLSGKFGSHEKALSAAGAEQDADIRDKAASKRFRLVLALPDDGFTGILAVEDISRSQPVSAITRWLRWSSRGEAVASSTPDKEAPWWRPIVHPLADEARLIQMISEGNANKLELVKLSITSARTRQQERFRVSAPVVDEGMAAQIAQIVKGWIRRTSVAETSGEVSDWTTDEEAAKQLAAVVGPEIANLDVDDGWVVLSDADEKTKKVSPTRMSEVFTYAQPRGDRSDTPTFYALVKQTAQRLQAAANLTIDWPAQ
ncbi:hypothetical protein GA0070606_3504 [Micromonospora citrea]|uniref:Uncharacterized protein n=1 Tax=Micromonospora citrea TaxID=47855 RepID=A0A1C6V685_9ACTN|nr:hypothetical protein [Micromonospora citrea]SCL61786.1 hypothetical protein GA0070606_3504 [Micromonospora citrea]